MNDSKVIYRKATAADIDAVAAIYLASIEAEEKGEISTRWTRDVYPVRATAEASLKRDDLYVAELDGNVIGTAILNQIQVDVYEGAPWEYEAPADKVMVMHTLAVDPSVRGKKIGTGFIKYYEGLALEKGWRYLRMDTSETNKGARKLYAGLGFKEIAIIPCVFNGIEGSKLVLLEKTL